VNGLCGRIAALLMRRAIEKVGFEVGSARLGRRHEKFILSMGIRKLPGSPQPMHEIYRDFLEEAVLAEKLGFDAAWASEHHFSPDAWSPSPVPFLAAVAARTQRIRIGTYVLLLPLHNPVRIAEDFAVVDNISGGRIGLPVGV
jgi:alkanesulfonate monooxygenase SsuD/methylene tetrahydromethanopterin reductase-like flavin-dependent oxidoreductase (luciferase family)